MTFSRTSIAAAAAIGAGPALAHPGHGGGALLHAHAGADQLLSLGWWAALGVSAAAVALVALRLARGRR